MTDSTLRRRVWTCLVAATLNVSPALLPLEQVNNFSLLVVVGLLLDATVVWRVLRSIPSADNPSEFESLTKLQIRGVHAIGFGSLGLMLALHLLGMLHVQGALFVLCGWVFLGVAHRVLGIAFEKRVAELREADSDATLLFPQSIHYVPNGESAGRQMSAYRIRRAQYLGVLFVAFPFGSALFMAAAIRWSAWFFVPLLLFVIACEYVSARVTCPDCGRPIGRGRTRLFGMSFEWWRLIPRSSCEYTGLPTQSKRAHWGEAAFKAIAWLLLGIGATSTALIYAWYACRDRCIDVSPDLMDRFVELGSILSPIIGLLGLAMSIYACFAGLRSGQ